MDPVPEMVPVEAGVVEEAIRLLEDVAKVYQSPAASGLSRKLAQAQEANAASARD